MLQTLLKFRNPDSTLDLNNQFAGFFKGGLISGGDVTPVPGILAVNVAPFKLMGADGMVVQEDSVIQQLTVAANQTNVVCFISQYNPGGDPVASYQVMEYSAYQTYIATPGNPFVTVFCMITLPALATQVLTSQIDYSQRTVMDPVGRNIIRGVLTDPALLPTLNNRPGDGYIITSGLGDNPALYEWNGNAWLNITDTLVVASLLSAHRNNLFPNEIHLTNEQAVAATGTFGTPGVEPIAVSISIPLSLFTLVAPISTDNLATGAPVTFSTTGTLPTGINNTNTFYAIVLSQTTFQVATSLANALANIPIVLGGTQSGVQTAIFAENKYVTSTDPRMIPWGSAGALAGLPSTPVPSGTNPFVTGSYAFAAPASTTLVTGAGPFTLSAGPFYVGTGGPSTVAQYFKLYSTTNQREFVDPVTGIASNVTTVYKQLTPFTIILDPSSEPSVIASNGFYNGPLYVTVSPALTSPALLRYANEQTLLTINPGAFEQPAYLTAQTTQETIVRLMDISGRVFDQAIPADETNEQLRIDLNTETQFNIASTAGFMTVHPSQFPRLAQTSFGLNFPVTIDQTSLYAGSAYTVDYSVAGYASFGLTTPDVGVTAIVGYTSVPNLSAIPLGAFFVDSAGIRWRILNSGIASGAILIYTGGETVTPYSAGGPYVAPGQIVAGNNPRALQLTSAQRAWFSSQSIPISGVDRGSETVEILPPGGNSVGTGSQAVSLIGTTVLFNNGNADATFGSGTGRSVFNVLPKRNQNFFDERVVLIGGWEDDSSGHWVNGYPAISGGANSAAAPCGIEITGYFAEVSLVTQLLSAQNFTFYVFVDGSYVSTVTPQTTKISQFGTPAQVMRFPLDLTLGVHTVRIEVVGNSANPFQLSGVQLYSTCATIQLDGGKDLADTSLLTLAGIARPIKNGLSIPEPVYKALWYVSPSGVLSMAFRTQKFYQLLGSATVGAGGAFTGSPVPTNLQAGDVLYYSTSGGQYQGLRVRSGYQGTPSAQLDAPTIPASPGGDGSISYLFRIPTQSDSVGTPVLGAAASVLDQEYTSLLFSDWDTGNTLDIANASVGLQTSLVTVLDDGVTTLAITNCTRVSSNIAGYSDGLALSSAGSEMNIQGFGSRMDVVFSGISGASTVSIEIDGIYTYTINVGGSGGPERHTLFFNGLSQIHTARIFGAAVANAVVVSEWSFYDLADPEFNGVPITKYAATENSYVQGVGPLTIPMQYNSPGLVVRDATRNAIFTNHGIPATWSIVKDFTINPRFGYYATTVTAQDYFTFDFTGQTFEIYILDTGAPGTLQFQARSSASPVYANLTSTNFPGFQSPTGQINAVTGVYSMGSTGNVIRVVGYGFNVADRYSIKVTNLNPTSRLSVLAIGENAPTYQIQKSNSEDTTASDLYFSSEQDIRNFLTLSPQQGGAIGVAGTGTGGTTSVVAASDVADLTPAGGYQAMMSNGFYTTPSDPFGQVDLGRTNATWNPAENLFNILAQQGVSVTVVGTAFTLNSAVTVFTPKPGDIIFNYAQNVFAVIATISGSSGTLDAAFPSDFAGGSCMVSQVVWTKNLVAVGDPSQGNQPLTLFPNAPIPVISVSYQDSLTAVANFSNPALVAVSASNSGLQAASGDPLSNTFAPLYERPIAPALIPDYPLLANPTNQRLFAAFFVVPNVSGNTSVNLIRYDISFYQDSTIANGGVLASAYAYNTGTALSLTPINSANPLNVGGVTEWQLNFPYIMNVNAGTTDGDLTVKVNGQVVPRYVAGAFPTPETYYVEVTPFLIRFNQDLITGQPSISLSGVRMQGVNDGSIVNSNRINGLANIIVGQASDVAAGTAQYSSLQAAITNAGTGAVIVVLSGVSITETVTCNKRVSIRGVGGYDSYINGTFTLQSGGSFCSISGIRVGQFILNSGANGNIIGSCFWTTDYADAGTGNSINGVNIT